MNDTAGSDVLALMASRPAQQILANLFTITLVSGPVYHLTDWRRPVVSGGVTYLPGPPRLQRGSIKVERGMAISTLELTVQEANAAFIAKLAQGYFNRALLTMKRVFAADTRLQWTSAVTMFAGRVNAIEGITRVSAKLTVKSLLDDLDNDYPRDVVEADCNAVLFDARCGLSAAAYRVTGTASAGSTKNKLLSGLSGVDVYFTQGVVIFTGGPMAGLAYMVKQYVGGVVYPAYPFLVAPAAGDTFSITPGCDKTLATCQAKYGYAPSSAAAPRFRGLPFVPDPTVTY